MKQFSAAELRRLSAEVERLNKCLRWEQHRAERIGTHGPDCWQWGHQHYECAVDAVKALREANDTFASERILPDHLTIVEKAQTDRDEALLRQALEFCEFAWRDVPMNDYAFETLEQTIAALRERLEGKA